jgi:hypothetical protein
VTGKEPIQLVYVSYAVPLNDYLGHRMSSDAMCLKITWIRGVRSHSALKARKNLTKLV